MCKVPSGIGSHQGGKLAPYRDDRLRCLREWASWVNSPFDEQRGASGISQERREKCYVFTEQNEDEFPTPPRAKWPRWTLPGYLNYYEQKYGGGASVTAGPLQAEPMSASGASGTPSVQQPVVGQDPNQPASTPKDQPGRIPRHYTVQTDPWFIDLTVGTPYQEDDEVKKEETSPKGRRIPKGAIPPMAYGPASESAGEEEIEDNEDWVYPPVQAGLHYERYRRTVKPTDDGTGHIKLLTQPSFSLKPMIEEAVVPSKATMSTFSCYLRKVTSYIACWSGCISMKILRQYRKRDDSEWVKLYNYCISEAKLRSAHLFLKAKDLAALCGVLTNLGEKEDELKRITKQRFLNSAASSTSESTEVSSGVRLANTGLFTDFDLSKKSLARNRVNLQGAL